MHAKMMKCRMFQDLSCFVDHMGCGIATGKNIQRSCVKLRKPKKFNIKGILFCPRVVTSFDNTLIQRMFATQALSISNKAVVKDSCPRFSEKNWTDNWMKPNSSRQLNQKPVRGSGCTSHVEQLLFILHAFQDQRHARRISSYGNKRSTSFL